MPRLKYLLSRLLKVTPDSKEFVHVCLSNPDSFFYLYGSAAMIKLNF